MLVKQTILSLLISWSLHYGLVEGLKMPDCSKSEQKEKPQCACKNPANWDKNELCQEFWHEKQVADSVEKMTRIVGGENAPRDAYKWFARLTYRSGSW